jgi:hypothetical protein
MPADASTNTSHGLLSITTGLGFLRGGSSSPIKMRQKPSREEQADIPTMSKDSLHIPQSSRLPLFGRARKKSNASAMSRYATESEAEETDNESRPRSMPLESTLPSQASTHIEQDRCASSVYLFTEKRNSREITFQAKYRQCPER